MSSFICGKCGREIVKTSVGYVTGCEHFPVGDILMACETCKYNWGGRCIKGHDEERYNTESLFYVFGCEDFKEE